MNRQLHLDTGHGTSNNTSTSQSGLSRRYSILQTPLEMHAPGVQPPTPDDPALRQRSPATIPAPTGPDYAQQQQQQQLSSTDADARANKEMGPSEKSQSQSQIQSGFTQHTTPPYIMPGSPPPPPPEQHPANFAPYADEMTQPQQSARDVQSHAHPNTENTIQPGPDAYGPVPTSPGPLPIKSHPTIATADQDLNHRSLAVEPDTNPLQSPMFPPATATGTGTATGTRTGTATSASHQTAGAEDLTTFHQPGQVRHPNQAIKGGDWSHSLCDCSNITACCLGIFCPCILYGKTQYRLGLKARKEDPTNMLGFDSCNGSCTAMALFCGCQWLMATIQHTRTRKAYDIPGNVGSDCIRATCCTCCTLIQDETEILKREEERARLAAGSGPLMVAPYVTPAQMSYPPPPR